MTGVLIRQNAASIDVLDKQEALDLYISKLGLEADTDVVVHDPFGNPIWILQQGKVALETTT